MNAIRFLEETYDRFKKRLPNRLLHSKIALESPVFISGLMRTGSYLLYDLLALSSDFTTPVRRTRRNKGLYGHGNWGKDNYQLTRSIKQIPVEGAFLWFKSGVHRSREDIDSKPYKPADLSRIADLVRLEYRGIRQGFTRGGVKFRILDKAPAFLSFISIIDHVFPDARYIFTIRDPRAVANSYLRRVRPPRFPQDIRNLKKYGTWGVPPRGWEGVRNKPLVYRICWQISEEFKALEDAFNEFGSERVRIVRYEGLVADPREITRSLLHFTQAKKYVNIKLIPERFQNFNPPWFDSSGNLAGEFGKDRMFKEEERDQFEPLRKWIDKLGYHESEISVVTHNIETRLQAV